MSTHSHILGTAGHIDHGKSALVQALTGVNPDRLPEEKKRGITIDLGFAPLDIGDVHFGIIDVPGHERFIRNMLAGSVGVDLALLVVAADDSIMPQTREHLAILQFLNIGRGLIAITKSDLVEPDWLELVEDDVRNLVEGTFLEGAPIVCTSARTGAGIDELKSQLVAQSRLVEQRAERDWFRMAVDRSFVLEGLGTVVTGSIAGGRLAVGDSVVVMPQNKTVRVRGIQSHGQAVEQVEQGQRAAINLMGIHHTEIERGCELVTPGRCASTRLVTAHVRMLPESPLGLHHRGRVRLHLGTQEIIASVHMLEGNVLEAGASGVVQFFTASPAVAVGRQPFVTRAESPLVTIGGGEVLMTNLGRLARRKHAAIEVLRGMPRAVTTERAAKMFALLGLAAMDETALGQQLDLNADEARALLDELVGDGVVAAVELSSTRRLFIHADAIAQWQARLLEHMGAEHARAPLAPGVSRQRLASQFEFLESGLLDALLDGLVESGQLKRIGSDELALSEFEPTLTSKQQSICEALRGVYRSAGFSPPEPNELAAEHGVSETEMRDLLDLLTALGDLKHLGTFVYVSTSDYERLLDLVSQHLTGEGLTMSAIRDLLGTSRKYALPIVAHLDKIGVTRRAGDLRLRGPAFETMRA